MRFSKAPLIATLMAVALSLLVILPALAENTDGHSYQGRTLKDELIVGVFSDVLDSQALRADRDPGGAPTALSLESGSLTRAYMLDTGADTAAADARDTFFNGKLYVSNQADAFSTVLVTHLAADGVSPANPACVSVRVRNENTGEQITLNLVPTDTNPTEADRATRIYFQNYFKVVDRDGEKQVDKHNGPYVCDGTVVYPASGTRGSSVPVNDMDLPDEAPDDDTDTEDVNEKTAFTATIALDESLARINASDGDRLTIRAGTHIQALYVDGEAPEFSEITPADGERFKSAALSIGFEIRDDGAGLRHDGENVVSNDGDAVLHDAATTTNTSATGTDDARIGDGDGITDREPISNRGGGSQDIDVTFYTPDQAMKLKAYEDAKAKAADARKASTAAQKVAMDAAAAATAAAASATDAGAVTDLGGFTPGASASTELNAASTALDAAATALGEVADPEGAATATTVSAAVTAAIAAIAEIDAALTAAKGATDGEIDGSDTPTTLAANKALLATAIAALGKAKTALTKAKDVLDAADADGGALALETAADVADTEEMDAEMAADEAAGADNDGVYGTLVDDHGSSGWTMVTRGVAYEARIVYNIVGQGKAVKAYQWMASATDRVGNTGKADKDRFDLVVDTLKPWVSEARTGISYNVSKDKEVRDRSYIALTFVNGMDNMGKSEDPIAASSLDVRDFIVEGFEVMDIIQPERITDKDKKVVAKAIDNDSPFEGDAARDPRSRLYLKLDSELDSDQKPRIQILGGAVSDLAGNPNDPPQTITSVDKIPAGLTITVTSSDSPSGRVVATEDGTFTVTVDADEPLKRTPRVYFSTFEVMAAHGENKDLNKVDDGGTLAKVTLKKGVAVSLANSNSAPALDVIERDLAWTQNYDADISAFDDTSNVYAVLVWSEDMGGNAGGSSGWMNAAGGGAPVSDDTLDLVALDDAGLLIEIDRGLVKATPEVLPSTADKLVTESPNPYLQLTFSETAENTAKITFVGVDAVEANAEAMPPVVSVMGIDTVMATFRSVKDGTDTVVLDAHKKVTLTAVTLGGKDVSKQVGPGMSTTEDKFVIALSKLEDGEHTLLEVGEHTLTYSAVDEAGNKLTDEKVTFEVKEHAPYKIAIRPGWNLISFPGTPADTGIGDVMGTGPDAPGIVLGYQNGAWVSAISNAGEWQGTLTEIVGGYGYWVQTTVFDSISAVIPSADPTNVLPSVPVIAGWNLLGVVDISQGKADSEPIGKEEADDYFVSIDWRVGYYFRNASNDWQKIVPDAEPSDGEPEILNGKGYWIWSIRPGKLVP